MTRPGPKPYYGYVAYTTTVGLTAAAKALLKVTSKRTGKPQSAIVEQLIRRFAADVSFPEPEGER